MSEMLRGGLFRLCGQGRALLRNTSCHSKWEWTMGMGLCMCTCAFEHAYMHVRVCTYVCTPPEIDQNTPQLHLSHFSIYNNELNLVGCVMAVQWKHCFFWGVRDGHRAVALKKKVTHGPCRPTPAPVRHVHAAEEGASCSASKLRL